MKREAIIVRLFNRVMQLRRRVRRQDQVILQLEDEATSREAWLRRLIRENIELRQRVHNLQHTRPALQLLQGGRR